MAYVAESGFADFSLRALAASIGTSHRMLIHHFGSKAGLESAIVVHTTKLMTTLLLTVGSPSTPLTSRQLIDSVWTALSAPEIEPLLRLYFELANRATNNDPEAKKAVQTIRDHWAATAGAPFQTPNASNEQMLGVAVTYTFLKGLLFDRLAGAALGDADEVLGQFTKLVEAYEDESKK